MAVIVDSSVLIDALGGHTSVFLLRALAEGTLFIPPIVVAEVLSAETTLEQREQLFVLLQDYSVHHTPLEHWMNTGQLRRTLRTKGVNVTLPDAHVAQCALDLDATLLTRDEIFANIARHTPLRLR